ncbi:MAG: carboxypeptidase-like regulatory domain-containing protein [Candidatus Dormiibacterota bacterium]
MSLIGYVSDERFVALSDVAVELVAGERRFRTRSSASGAVEADVPPGRYLVTLAAPGFGPKRVEIEVGGAALHQFRLLSDQILGYVWPKWVRGGEAGEPRVHSPEPYRLSLRRYGVAAEEERLIGWFDEHGPRAMVQVTPDGDYTQEGVGWNRLGYANASYRPTVSAPERSGLYYFHAETETGRGFSFPWVVAPARPTAPIAVLASTNTWNAYNNFGGRSNYINAAGLPDLPTVVARHDLARYLDGTFSEHAPADQRYPPLSFERPEPLNQVGPRERADDPIRGRQTCHLAPAEWRLLSWLERQRLAYDLYAEAQLHDGTLQLDRYRVLILNAHPEYWSRAMVTSVSEWVEQRRGRLLYLGGNGLDCEVEFVPPDRLHFLTQDPDPDGPHDSRMHRTFASPTGLLGVTFTQAGAMTSAPYRVVDADHWVFAGTRLANGERFGEASLHERCPGGASGHETDKMNANSPPGTHLLAKGCNVDDGGAEMVIRQTPSGGAVFAVGSITWPASILVDPAVAGITRNVLDRFLVGAPVAAGESGQGGDDADR